MISTPAKTVEIDIYLDLRGHGCMLRLWQRYDGRQHRHYRCSRVTTNLYKTSSANVKCGVKNTEDALADKVGKVSHEQSGQGMPPMSTKLVYAYCHEHIHQSN